MARSRRPSVRPHPLVALACFASTLVVSAAPQPAERAAPADQVRITVAANVTLVEATASGVLQLDVAARPGDAFATAVYQLGKTRANFAIVPINEAGAVVGILKAAPGVVGHHGVEMLLDVTGYFD